MLSIALANKPGQIDLNESTLSSALTPDELACVRAVHGAGTEAYETRADSKGWTFRIKRALLDTGNLQGYLTFPRIKGDTRFEGEWMFDVVWVKTNPKQAPVQRTWHEATGLALATDCEWGETEDYILEDFLKLTFCRADSRLFVYQNKPYVRTRLGNTLHPVDLCRGACPVGLGNRYLAIGFASKRSTPCRVDAWIA